MSFAKKLITWYEQHGRHDLPWQLRGDSYPVWVSEIMLQQTQVRTVIPYFTRFINQFPGIQSLANAKQDQVLHLWSGLGYYARGRNLHKTATIISEQYGSIFTEDIDELIALPGIGRSTAGAILAQSLGQRHPILDGNVKRVLCRYYRVGGWPGQSETTAKLWQLSDQNTPSKNVADYTQAIMDLGATVCKRSSPACDRCPLQDTCQSFQNGDTDTYPHKRSRKILPVKSTTFLLVKNSQGEIYLTKRPPSGIWGGLWCLPEVQTESDTSEYIKELSAAIDADLPSTVTRHTFSHYHLDFRVIPATVKGNHTTKIRETAPAIWYNPSKPAELGLAAPIKKLIHRTEVQHG